jgi:hypothetical protein
VAAFEKSLAIIRWKSIYIPELSPAPCRAFFELALRPFPVLFHEDASRLQRAN